MPINPGGIRSGIVRTLLPMYVLVLSYYSGLAGGYYGTAFQGYQGMNHGGPLSLTIFNVVVGAVVRHWVSLLAEVEEGPVESWGGTQG